MKLDPELRFQILEKVGIYANRFSILEPKVLFNTKEVLEKSQLQHFNEFEPKDFALRNNDTSEFVKDKNGNLIFQYNEKLLLEDNLSNTSPDDFYTITFCSVKGISVNDVGEFRNQKGVRFVHQKLRSNCAGYYYANDDFEVDEDIQNYFLNFTIININYNKKKLWDYFHSLKIQEQKFLE